MMDKIEKSSARITSIDLLRGIVMIIMALDHTRDFFHYGASIDQNPMDFSTTNTTLYLTRWITHFCAPVFVFLSGTSIFLSAKKFKTKKELSRFLLTRGIWLILVEIFIIVPVWEFNITSIDLQVIWVIGLCMCIMSALVYLPVKVLFATGLAIIFFHNLLDDITITEENFGSFLWSLVHERHAFPINDKFRILVAYPFLPWLGLMIVGYCTGHLFRSSSAKNRKAILFYTGIAAIILFILLRSINLYGDMHRWARQSNLSFTILDFIKVTKYPPSLLFILMTVGPALVILALVEKTSTNLTKQISIFGKVPFFYYILHILLIHLLAMLAFFATGHTTQELDYNHYNNSTLPPGFGFPLWVVYVAWGIVILLLYVPCKWYCMYKLNNRKWWLSYV
jgi:uncharacterized membrane protein